MGAAEDIAEALEPTVRAAGLEIWDVECSGASVRVLVERPGGVDLEAISALSKAVSDVLDKRDDLVPNGHYLLEVSSPGLERRLRRTEHFARYVGERVAVKTTEPVQGARRLRGTLLAVGAEAIVLRLEDAEAPPAGAAIELRVPLRSVERANAVFEWGPPARHGRPQASKVPAQASKVAR